MKIVDYNKVINHNLSAEEKIPGSLTILDKDDQNTLSQIQEELGEFWRKRQIFRTNTEAHLSVLNNSKHPTRASKYWQSVREMTNGMEQIVRTSFDIKRNLLKIEETKLIVDKLIKKNKEKYKFKILKLQILLEEMEFNKIIRNSEIKDQVREVKMWTDICKDLDNGSFNTIDPDDHQAESLKVYFENRLKALGPGSDMADVMTTRGMVKSASELTDDSGKLLSFKKAYALEGKDIPLIQEKDTNHDEINTWARNKKK